MKNRFLSKIKSWKIGKKLESYPDFPTFPWDKITAQNEQEWVNIIKTHFQVCLSIQKQIFDVLNVSHGKSHNAVGLKKIDNWEKSYPLWESDLLSRCQKESTQIELLSLLQDKDLHWIKKEKWHAKKLFEVCDKLSDPALKIICKKIIGVEEKSLLRGDIIKFWSKNEFEFLLSNIHNPTGQRICKAFNKSPSGLFSKVAFEFLKNPSELQTWLDLKLNVPKTFLKALWRPDQPDDLKEMLILVKENFSQNNRSFNFNIEDTTIFLNQYILKDTHQNNKRPPTLDELNYFNRYWHAFFAVFPEVLQQKDNDGWGPLHYAALHQNTAWLEVLIEKGLDVTETDKAGYSPRDLIDTLLNFVQLHEKLDKAKKGIDLSEKRKEEFFSILDREALNKALPDSQPTSQKNRL